MLAWLTYVCTAKRCNMISYAVPIGSVHVRLIDTENTLRRSLEEVGLGERRSPNTT